MSGSLSTELRLVRCPRCKRVLPEPTNVPKYKCGGCNTVLRGKKPDSEKIVDVMSKEKIMSNSFLTLENMLKAVKENKVNDKESVKENEVSDNESEMTIGSYEFDDWDDDAGTPPNLKDKQGSVVPKFGDWVSGENAPNYTVYDYYNKAVDRVAGKIINPNDIPQQNQLMFPHSTWTRLEPEPIRKGVRGCTDMRQVSREDGEFMKVNESAARNENRDRRAARDQSRQQRHGVREGGPGGHPVNQNVESRQNIDRSLHQPRTKSANRDDEIYDFFMKKDDLRVLFRRGEKPDAEMSFDVRSKENKDNDKALVKVYYTRRVGKEGCWDSMELEHPATLEELGMDPENKGIISDFFGFVEANELCKRIGRPSGKDNCLVYEYPSTGRWRIIAAMANHLQFDIYHLDLTSFSCFAELEYMLCSTRNRSIIAIEGLYHCAWMPLNLKTDKSAVQCLAQKIGALFLRPDNERIFVFTTNHEDQHDVASLRPVKMDIYIHMSLPRPMALPDGGKGTYHNGLLVSNSEEENMRAAYDSTKRYSLPNFDAIENKVVKVYSRWGRDYSYSMELEPPPTFAELGKDPENEGIISDLLSFVRDKELYKRIGKKWKRGYLLYDSPGTDRSSLIAAMANCLEFDIYDLDLTDLSSICELQNVLLCNRNRSLIAIKDFDHWFGMHPNLKDEVFSLRRENELTLSGLFEIIDGLVSCCWDQQLIVLTTNHNHRDRFHTALLHPLNIDAYMHTSSPQPIALPDGGEIVQLDSFEQKPLVDFDATNNRAYDSRTRISLTDFDAPDCRADLVRAYQSTPIMFTSENKDTRGGLNGECLTKNVLNDDLTKQELLPERTSLAFTKLTSEDIDGFYDSIFVDSDSDKFDYGARMLSNLKDEVVDGLSSSCCDERITVSTTNNRDPRNAALLPLVNRDTDIHTASPQPIALLDGGEIVQLESIEQKSLVDFDATNNRAYQSGVLVSSEKKNTIEAYKGQWESLIQRTKKDMGEGLNEECLTKSALGLDDSTEQNSVDPGRGRGHLHSMEHEQPATQRTKKDMGEGLNEECLTKSALGLDDSTEQNSVDPGRGMGHLHSMEHEQPATFAKLGTDPENEAIVSDLLRFVREKKLYKRVGKAWKRGYLLYDPPCKDRSSLMAYMANRLEFDIHDLDLPGLSSIEELTNVLVSIMNRSLIVIKDIDHCVEMLPNLKSEFASSSLWPIGLPDRRHIVVLDPLEQSTKNVAHAARVDQCSPTVSLLEKKMLRKILKRKCRTMSVVFEIHQQHFGRKCEGSAKSFHATCIGKKHGTNQVSTVKRIHKQHRIHQWPFCHKWATRKRYSVGDERSFQVSPVSMNEKLDSWLQFIHMSQRAKADESDPTVSNSEKGSLREALKCDSLTNTRSLNDLREHFGARRKEAAKGLCGSLALKSFEVLDSLPLGEQSYSIRNVARRRTLTHKHCVRLKKSQDLQQSLLSDCSGELAAQAALGLPDGGHIPSLPEKKIARKTLKRKSRTMSVLSLEDHQQHVGRRWEDDAKFLGAKRICRQLAIDRKPTEKRILRQHGTRRCQSKQSAIDLPDGGHILSLSKKKIVRKTLKRKCRNMSVPRSEYHQHVDSKWDAVKSLGGAHAAKHIYRQLVIHCVSRAKRICRQHGFHRWPFQQNWAILKGYFLGDERPVDVICLSMDGKLVSRLQLIHISWLGRFSPRPPALPPGEIVGPPLALSSSQLPSTSNRAHLGGQDRSGSTTSHSQNERTRDQPEGHKRKIKNLTIEDLRPYVGLTRADAAKKFQMSETTFKRQCRRLKIEQWPKLPPGEEVLKPPDPPERNTGQIAMGNEVGHLPEPIEVSRLPYHERNGSLQDYIDDLLCGQENDSMDFQSAWQEMEPNPTHDVFLQNEVASTHMVSGNMGIPNDHRNSLASQAETRLKGHGTGSSLSQRIQDMSFVMLKVYGLDTIKFKFPLASGINELKGEVAKRLNLEPDSFNMKYEDEEGEQILIPLSEDLRDYLSSSITPVIKLWVVSKVANLSLCESCGGSFKR